MMRRRGGSAARAEPCGVWLDTAELKRGPARPLRAKPKAPTRSGERKLPQPGSRQSSILPFLSSRTGTAAAAAVQTHLASPCSFSGQESSFSAAEDERDKENSRPTPFTPNKDCKDTGTPSACPVKILALPQLEGAQEEPFGAEQGLQGTSWAWKAPLDSLELPGESQSHSKASCGAGGDSWCCSFSQGSEHDRIIAHRNKSRLFPGETTSGSRKPQHRSRIHSGMSSAGTENTNPIPGAAPRAARGVCSSPQRPGGAQPLQERHQNTVGALGESCRQLFCQDSQGNRVIAHGDRASSPRDDCSPSQPWEQQLELSSQSLFTQDSEGNRVIKHW